MVDCRKDLWHRAPAPGLPRTPPRRAALNVAHRKQDALALQKSLGGLQYGQIRTVVNISTGLLRPACQRSYRVAGDMSRVAGSGGKTG